MTGLRPVSDILEEVATAVRGDIAIRKLGEKLHVTPGDIEQCLTANNQTQDVRTLEMLEAWELRGRSPRSLLNPSIASQVESQARKLLKSALVDAGQKRLADRLFPPGQ